MERSVLAGADRVVTASRLHADALRARLGEPGAGRVRHLPNGYESTADPATTDARGDESDGAFLVVFTGTMAQLPETETLLEAVHELLARHPEGRRRLRVELLGPYESGYEDRSIALGLKGIVRFNGPRPHAESRDLQRRADVLVLLKPRGPRFWTMVPGKLYEYLHAGRPLVALLDPEDEAAALARRAGAVVLPAGRREPLTQELERLYLAWRERGRSADVALPWLAENSREHLAGELAAVLDEVARR
jgi:glycosyltransferase involved in cell wall biosynthesis